MGYLFGFVIAFAPTAVALFAAAKLSRHSVEDWQLLAWVPPMPLAAWWVYFVIAVLRDATSHNLWPLEMVLWAVVSAVLFGVFLVGRKVLSPSAEARGWRR